MNYLHTEFVRLLEQRGHLFPADPIVVTEQLRDATDDAQTRLYRRARLLDADQSLQERLQLHQQRRKALTLVMRVLWFVLGFVGTYGLMQQSRLNFLLILSSVLGLNTVMLLWWCVQMCRHQTQTVWVLDGWWGRKTDVISETLLKLYAHITQQTYFRWQIGAESHRLALSALTGMFVAVLLLLSVRQYSFNWESTLFGEDTFAKLVALLGYLPSQLGFSVPDVAAVLANRNQADTVYAAHWGSLLLGSMICYGMLPRALAWGVCVWQIRQTQPVLDLGLPYYQSILAQWQRRITDDGADFHQDTPKKVATVVRVNAQQFWALTLDVADAPENWYHAHENHTWQDKGSVSERDDMARVLAQLLAQHESVRLLVGIRAHSVPDRGVIRRLVKLAEHAQGGLVLALLNTENANDTIAQWHQTAEQYGWTICT